MRITLKEKESLQAFLEFIKFNYGAKEPVHDWLQRVYPIINKKRGRPIGWKPKHLRDFKDAD